METERDELVDVARRWITLWQGAGLSGFDDLHAPDFVDHSPSGRGPDRAGFRAGIVELYRAFPDFHGIIEDLVVEPGSSKVAIRWAATGTHEGPFLGFPRSGARVRFAGIEIIRVTGGKVAERWGEWDGLGIVEQIRFAAKHGIEIEHIHTSGHATVDDLG